MHKNEVLSEKMANQNLDYAIMLVVEKSIEERLKPVIQVLEKSKNAIIDREEAIEILDVSDSGFLYYHKHGMLNPYWVVDGSLKQWYKLSEVLALVGR